MQLFSIQAACLIFHMPDHAGELSGEIQRHDVGQHRHERHRDRGEDDAIHAHEQIRYGIKCIEAKKSADP